MPQTQPIQQAILSASHRDSGGVASPTWSFPRPYTCSENERLTVDVQTVIFPNNIDSLQTDQTMTVTTTGPTNTDIIIPAGEYNALTIISTIQTLISGVEAIIGTYSDITGKITWTPPTTPGEDFVFTFASVSQGTIGYLLGFSDLINTGSAVTDTLVAPGKVNTLSDSSFIIQTLTGTASESFVSNSTYGRTISTLCVVPLNVASGGLMVWNGGKNSYRLTLPPGQQLTQLSLKLLRMDGTDLTVDCDWAIVVSITNEAV